MQRKPLIFLFLVLYGLQIFAQKRLNGIYDAQTHTFIYTDANIIVRPFINGRAAFMIKGTNPFAEKANKVGYIDTSGKVVIKPLYDNCSNFYGDFALVMDTARRLAVINRYGKIIVPFAMQDIALCSNGLFIISTYPSRTAAAVMRIVNKRNKIVVPPGRYTAYALPPYPMNPYNVRISTDDVGHQEFIWYQVWHRQVRFDNYLGVKKDQKWAVIDRSGKEVIPAKFDWIGIFSNGRAPFSIDKKYGVVDSTGKILIPPVYDNLELSGNKFVIAIQNKKWGLLDVNGKMLIPFKYDIISQMAGDAFAVRVGGYHEAKWGIVNASGITVIPAENNEIEQFGAGYYVEKDNSGAALFDSTGVQRTQYGGARPADYPVWEMGDEGFMVYNARKREYVHYEQMDEMMYHDDDKWGLIDSAGEEVTRPLYDEFRYTENKKVIAVRQDKKWSFINSSGKKLTRDMFDAIEFVGDYFIKVKKDGKYGVMNRNGKLVIPVKYDEVSFDTYCRPGSIQVLENGRAGLIDCTGKVIYDCKYTSIYCKDGKIIAR